MLGVAAKGAGLLSTPSGHCCPCPIAYVPEKRQQSPGLSFPPGRWVSTCCIERTLVVLGVTEPSGLVSRRHPPLGSGSGSNLPKENYEGNWGILAVPGWLVMAGLCAFTREQGVGGGLYAGRPGMEGQRPPSPTGAFPGQDGLPWR